MSAMSNNPSHDHHFVPVFYLANWVDQTRGQLVEYKTRYHGVLPRWTGPKGTGYERHLYDSVDGSAKSLEPTFMMPADTDAAQAMTILLGAGPMEWTRKQRSAWSRFLMGMLLRHPEDVAELKQLVDDDWTNLAQDVRDRYTSKRTSEMPETAEEWWELNRDDMRETARLKWHRTLMDHEGIGRRFNSMHWGVANLQAAQHALLTSDRPVCVSGSIADPEAFVILPLSPTKAFIAARRVEIMNQIVGQNPTRLGAELNKEVVRNARRFVFSADSSQTDFIQKHFAKAKHLSLIQKLAIKRKNERAANALTVKGTHD